MAIISSLEKDQVNEIAQEVYEKFEKQTGKVPEWVKVMAHNPKIVKEFTELFRVIMGEGEIEPYLKWKIGYTISEMLRCPLELVKDITADAHLDKPEIVEKLKKKLTEAQIIEIVSVIGLFNYINRFNNTLTVLPE